ncbi:MAG TPA: hypothetical protein VHE30_21335 [Polyangiaceae bacterium]|nr:hypothetical protein [Polyangiaceae bacterium]
MNRFAFALMLVGCSSGPPADDRTCLTRPDRRTVCGPPAVTLAANDAKGFVVDGSIDGKPAHLLVDTGAERTVLSAKLLGAEDQSGVISTFCAGDVCFRESVWAWDTLFSSDDPDGYNGFIGMSTLADLVVGVEPGDPTRIELQARGDACSGTAVDLDYTDRGIPLGAGAIDGEAVTPLPIDSGSLYTTIGGAHAASLSTETEDVSDATLCTVNGCDTRVSVGTFTGQFCLFDRCPSSVPVKYPVADVVGASFLKQFRLDFDFPNHRLVFCDE